MAHTETSDSVVTVTQLERVRVVDLRSSPLNLPLILQKAVTAHQIEAVKRRLRTYAEPPILSREAGSKRHAQNLAWIAACDDLGRPIGQNAPSATWNTVSPRPLHIVTT